MVMIILMILFKSNKVIRKIEDHYYGDVNEEKKKLMNKRKKMHQVGGWQDVSKEANKSPSLILGNGT